MDKTINIEVAYAKPDEQMIVPLNVPVSTIAEQAIKKSQILIFFPEIDLKQNKIGIFSKPCKLDTLLRNKDRVEIYRPLIADPKEARRKKAAVKS
ncbi:RnfH family protein [Candidatus Halobeggiatoa sp. HSG11]|nr:RnfH family protein [Candidatus Halobeggiatoa sp. HSG11]